MRGSLDLYVNKENAHHGHYLSLLLKKLLLPNASMTGLESNTLFSILSTVSLSLGEVTEAATEA